MNESRFLGLILVWAGAAWVAACGEESLSNLSAGGIGATPPADTDESADDSLDEEEDEDADAECSENSDCFDDERCDDGACVPKNQPSGGGEGAEGASDGGADGDGGEVAPPPDCTANPLAPGCTDPCVVNPASCGTEGFEGEGIEGSFPTEGVEGTPGPEEGTEGTPGTICAGAFQPCAGDADCCTNLDLVCSNGTCTQFCGVNPNDPKCTADPCSNDPNGKACACQKDPQSAQCLGGNTNCQVPGGVQVACQAEYCCNLNCQGNAGCESACFNSAVLTAGCDNCLLNFNMCAQQYNCVLPNGTLDSQCAFDNCVYEYAECFPLGPSLPAGTCLAGEACEYVGGYVYACVPGTYPQLTAAAGAQGGSCTPACGANLSCAEFTTPFCTVSCVPAAPGPAPTGGTQCPNFSTCVAKCANGDAACANACRQADPGCDACLDTLNACYAYENCYDVASRVDTSCVFGACGAYYGACFGPNIPPNPGPPKCPSLNNCAGQCFGDSACIRQCIDAEGADCQVCLDSWNRCDQESGCVVNGQINPTCDAQFCGAYATGCLGN